MKNVQITDLDSQVNLDDTTTECVKGGIGILLPNIHNANGKVIIRTA